MKTTMNIEDGLLQSAKELALRSHRTVTSLIEEGLRRVLSASAARTEASPDDLPTHRGGGLQPGIDLADNEALRDLMDGLR